jgi:hypothetical protein
MKIEVNLTEEQLNELIATKSLVLKLNVKNCNIEPISTTTKWPDTKDCKPAELLIKRLKRMSFSPSDLPNLSRQRVARLVRIDQTSSLNIDTRIWKKVEQVEEAFGITFHSFDLPSSDIQTRIQNAFVATFGDNREGIEGFLTIVCKPLPQVKAYRCGMHAEDKVTKLAQHARMDLIGTLSVYNETDLKTVGPDDMHRCNQDNTGNIFVKALFS